MADKFETSFIKETIEQTPFENIPAQDFFTKWCEINDSIVPQFIERDQWENRGVQGILEKDEKGKQTLFVPKDLHLWEMVDIIKAVDYDTLARNPSKRQERAEKVRELGETFEKAGLYLSEYSPILEAEDEKQIAKDIATKFYQYGLSLQNKEKNESLVPSESTLSKEDKEKLDEWFLGRDSYKRRLERLSGNPSEEEIEEARMKLLSGYFKALASKGYKADGEKPWQTEQGPIQHLQERTQRQIAKAIETPKRELETSIFRRGMEKLVTEMKDVGWRTAIQRFLQEGYDLNIAEEKIKLYNTLEIPKLKSELERIRQSGNITQISVKELEIAQKIQLAVIRFPYKMASSGDSNSNYPSKMLETQFINCVGSSILGGGLLDEIGIKYLHADLPEHSSTVLITSNGKIYWQDFTPPGSFLNYMEIIPGILTEKIDFSRFNYIPESGFTIKFKPWTTINNKPLRITLFNPEIGLQLHILNNTGNALCGLGRNKEAVEAYKQAIQINTQYALPYNGLGNALSGLGRNKEAVEAYKQAIQIDTQCAPPYNGLGNALSGLGRNKEAIEVYKQAIQIDTQYVFPYNGLGNALHNLDRNEEAIEAYKQAIRINTQYAPSYNGLGDALRNLGRNKEAIEAYKIFIELWKGDEYWTGRAKWIIQELGKKISR